MGYSKGSSKREINNCTGLPEEKRKISNKKSSSTPKGPRKRKTNKT